MCNTARVTAEQKNADNKRRKSRAQKVKPGFLPVSEFAFDRAGAASPFGDDITFPVPIERLTYRHPVESRADVRED